MCITPVRLRAGKGQVVPCGRCPECKDRRSNAWIFRLQAQEKHHAISVFATLTYSNESMNEVGSGRITSKGFQTLVKQDFQLFMKRLRKNTQRNDIKYYAAGEYGTDSNRPHFHAIIYDATPEEIDKAWGLGHVVCGTVTGSSIAYTTKYICKDKRIPLFVGDDRTPEFSLMSQGLGKAYLTPQMQRWHIANEANYVVREGGYKQPIPRYLRDKIFSEEQKNELNVQSAIRHKEAHDKAVDEAGGITEFYRLRGDYVRQVKFIAKQKERVSRNKV